jgi:hypothetical protein
MDHECQIGRRRPESAMRCAKNLINSITPPMNAKINPQIFSVLGVTGFSGVSSLWEILNGNCDAMRVKIHHSLKSPACFVRLSHVARLIVNANHGIM